MLCYGRFRKTETSGDKGKISTIEDGRENKGDKSDGSSHKRKLQNPEQMNLSDVKKTKYDGPTTSGTKSPSCSTRNFQRRVTNKRIKLSSVDALDAKIPKKPRTSRSKRHGMYDFVEKIELAEKKNLNECKRRETIPVANRWFTCYGDEESEEDVEPLVNNRTERRKREKLLKLQNKRIQDSVVYILDDDDDDDDDD